MFGFTSKQLGIGAVGNRTFPFVTTTVCARRHVATVPPVVSKVVTTAASAVAPPPPPPPPPQSLRRGPRRVGGILGTVLGFALGVSLAGSYAMVKLVGEYRDASLFLLTGLEDIQASTDKIKNQLAKIDTLETKIARLEATTATRKELADTKATLLKSIDVIESNQLELKTRVWDLLPQISSK